MRHWHRYERAYLLLAALATPLVLSVHTIVSFDFAVSQLPGWHTTIFPPYFVAGAIFSGFAMVLTLAIPSRELWGLKNFITLRHLENMAKIILLTGTMVGYAYAMEFFMAWYSGEIYEQFAFINRAFGQYAWAYWIMVSCNVITPQIFWFKWCRRNIWILFFASLFVNIGMWFERYVITVTSLANDFLPAVGNLPAHMGGHAHLRRKLRAVHDALPALHPIPADSRDRGDQDGDAGGRSPRRARSRSS